MPKSKADEAASLASLRSARSAAYRNTHCKMLACCMRLCRLGVVHMQEPRDRRDSDPNPALSRLRGLADELRRGPHAVVAREQGAFSSDLPVFTAPARLGAARHGLAGRTSAELLSTPPVPPGPHSKR